MFCVDDRSGRHEQIKAVKPMSKTTVLFFDTLFSQALEDTNGDASIVLWTPDSHIEKHTSTTSAGEAASRIDSTSNVYFSCCMMRSNLPASRRGGVADVHTMVGLWADIDIAKPDNAKKYPPNKDCALQLSSEIGLKPSLIIETGGGLHAWWLFSEPLVFSSEQERIEASRVSSSWISTINSCAASHEWVIDSVGDLSRVLRPVGTRNHKTSPPFDVKFIDGTDLSYVTKYTYPDDFEPLLVAEEYSVGQRDSVVTVGPVKVPPSPAAPHAVGLSRSDARFRKTWDRTRSDLHDQSASSYEMAIANEGVYRGWTDQEIADAFMAWRMAHGENTSKLMRRDYVTRTIGLAREGRLQAEALNAARTMRPSRAGQTPTENERREAVERLSEIFGRRVLRWIRHTGEEPIYTLVLAGSDDDDELSIRIGNSACVRSHKMFADALYAAGLQSTTPSNRWSTVTALLLTACEDVTNPEGTLDARIRRWLVAYADDVVPSDGDDVSEAIGRHKPFRRDSCVLIYAQDFIRYIDVGVGVRIKPNRLYDDLRAFGATPKVVADKLNQTTVHYWSVSDSLLYNNGDGAYSAKDNLDDNPT